MSKPGICILYARMERQLGKVVVVVESVVLLVQILFECFNLGVRDFEARELIVSHRWVRDQVLSKSRSLQK